MHFQWLAEHEQGFVAVFSRSSLYALFFLCELGLKGRSRHLTKDNGYQINVPRSNQGV